MHIKYPLDMQQKLSIFVSDIFKSGDMQKKIPVLLLTVQHIFPVFFFGYDFYYEFWYANTQ